MGKENKMKKQKKAPILIMITALLLAACNMPLSGPTEPTAEPMTVETLVALTLAALPTPMTIATQVPPTQEQAQPTLSNTATSYPTYTPYPAPTVQPCDQAGWGADLTIPDNTKFAPGATFTKKWRIFNTGSCTWSTSYKIVFDSGDGMSGPASFSLPTSVAPGQSIDIAVDLKAPTTMGTFQGNWKVQNASGQKFGLGAGNAAFYVKIIVESTAFAILNASIEFEHSNIEADCASPLEFHLMAHIKSSAPGAMTFYWEFDDGTTSGVKSHTYTGAGTKDFSYNYSTDVEGDHWARIYIDDPNHQYFDKYDFHLTCTP
jgi:hypothetical protein